MLVPGLTTHINIRCIHSFIHVCMHLVVFIDAVGSEYIVMNKKGRVFILMKLVF